MPTLLIVDDHAAVRAGLAALIGPEPDLRVVATAADAEAALARAEEHRPDVALIDFHLPGEDGLELCLRLDGVAPRPRRVLYSAFADERLAVLAIVAGVQRVAMTPSPAAMTTVSAALEPADLPVLGMLIHGTPPAEVADTLAMSPDWLLARRWAILQRLSPRRARRGTLATDAPLLLARQHRSPGG